jgi:hypothetical protein
LQSLQTQVESVNLAEQQATKGSSLMNTLHTLLLLFFGFLCVSVEAQSCAEMHESIKKDLRKLLEEIDKTQWKYTPIDKLLGM